MKQWRPWLLGSSVLFVAHAAMAEGEIPQMDQTWYPNQLLWLAVSFGALYAVVSWFIAPTIQGILTTRENAINDAISEAEKAKSAAESNGGEVESIAKNARVRAAELMAQAQAQNNSDAADALTKLNHELARKAEHADAILEEAVKKALSSVDAAAADLAKAMVGKILNQDAAPDTAEPKLKLAVKR